ncbi:MAG TPA: hypothetical protein PLW78_10965 [bacterium]|nr:hypothetical protein [bacterium]HPM46665.1 hypothetical protein [bacterium]HRQ70810.1 hypothetical protein [bacterium]
MGHNDHEDRGFKDFLQQIVEGGFIEQPVLGITKQVISKGEESLSEKQKAVFRRKVVDFYKGIKCKRCGDDISWSEKYDAISDHGMCNYCSHKTEKGE